ncbi:hypothetical protein PENTCL1PPCAC_14821, partial [Pristionchus entomophagus]
AAGFRFPRALSMTITTLQTLQMFIGVVITFLVLYLKMQGNIVQQSYENLGLTFAIYALLAILFTTFFNDSYGGEKQKKAKDCNGTVPCLLEARDREYYYIPYEYGSLVGPEKWWNSYDKEPLFEFISDVWHHSIWVAILYCLGVHALQRFMENRQPFVLMRPLILWNAALAIFSMIGFARLGEEFIFVLRTRSLLDSISYSFDPHQPATFWGLCFAVSKLFELVDTLFVVLRKKNLIFLHWFHHAAVVVYCAHSSVEIVAATRWFMVMNYGVHSAMYSYYAITAAGHRLPRALSMTITTLQTTQMFIGVAITFIVLYLKLQGNIVQQSFENLGLTFAIYALLAVLFTSFFNKSYIDEAGK